MDTLQVLSKELKMAKIYGFTLLRNGIKYDYSFMECLTVLSLLVDKIYIALGDCDDGTKEALQSFDNLVIIDTIWDPKIMGDGGQILSQQTNIALEALRRDHGHEDDAWAMYLQCDELIHEREIEEIKSDIELAQKDKYDSIRFRYFHFWKNHYNIAISKRWYPQEVRCIKLKSDIRSFGDAQGFSNITNPLESDCHIYHYGHVRDAEKLAQKQELLTRMIRPAEQFKKYFSREKRAFANTEYIPLIEKHPSVMKSRIQGNGESYEISRKEIVYIVDKYDEISNDIIKRINAKHVIKTKKSEEVPFEYRMNQMVLVSPTLMDKVMYPSKVIRSLKSPLAREWTAEIRLRFLLSEKGIGLN